MIDRLYGSLEQNIGQARLQRVQTLVQSILPWLIGLAFVAVEIRRVSHQIAVRYPDFFGWAERAARLNFRDITDPNWVHGLYPLGYPVLLRLGVTLGTDVLRTAFAISILGGFLGLLGTFYLVRRMTHNWTLAILTEGALGCMAFYLFYANLDATDMLSAGLQICSLALLMGETNRHREALIAGLLVGLSYLIRYTASLTVLPCTLFLLLPFLMHRERESLVLTSLYLLGALMGGAPQFMASFLIKGNPLYNEQAHNLWFHLQNSADYIYKWREVPMDISTWEVIAAAPREFFLHWWKVFKSYWLSGDGYAVDGLLGLFAHAGFWYALIKSGQLRRPARTFMAVYIVGFIAVLSMTRLDRRFLITLMPLQVFGSLYFLWDLIPINIRIRGATVPLRTPLLVLIVISYMGYPLNFMKSNPFDEEIVEVSNVLHAAGMQSASEVFSTHVEYHDVADPWKARFDMAAFIGRDLSTYNEIRNFIQERSYRYFIFDEETGLFMYPEQEALLHPENRPAGLSPIYVPDKREAMVYRVEGPQWPDPQPVDAQFREIVLIGYSVFQSQDAPPGSGTRMGLYLHWQATGPISESYKVFVHVMDSQGQLVTQHDGIPALWTYPTERWQAGEEIVDFHPLHFDPRTGPGPFTLRIGLYDPATGERLAVQTDTKEVVDNAVVLETLVLDK